MNDVQQESLFNIKDENDAWLAEQINLADHEQKVLIDYPITPGLAAALLRLPSGHHRSIMRFAVNAYRTMMERNEWKGGNHQGFAVDWNGSFHDGRNRSTAIVECGVTVRGNLHFGVDPDTFDVVDSGRNRTMAHVLEMDGHSNSRTLAAIVRALVTIKTSRAHDTRKGSDFKLTRPEVRNYIAENPGILRAARIVGEFQEAHKKLAMPSGLGAGFFIIERDGRDSERVSEFLDHLKTGVGLTSTDPILKLRDIMIARNFLSPIEAAALVVKAFNAYSMRRTVKVLRWAKGEDFPSVSKQADIEDHLTATQSRTGAESRAAN